MPRFNWTREAFIPKGSAKVSAKRTSAVAYLYERGDRFFAAMFSGKRAKPDHHYRFRTEEQRAASVRHHFESVEAREQAKIERKRAEQAKGRGVEVGDILRCSWGYEQTNIDYYEVTALIGKTMVELREIGAESTTDGFMQGKCIPVAGNYIGEPMRKRAKNGAVRITSYAYAFRMEPTIIHGAKVYESSRWSSYA